MPVKVDMSIQGSDALKIKFGDPKHTKEAMKKFLREGGKVARKDLRARLPRRTGKARRSVRVKLDLKTFQAKIFSPLHYVRILTTGSQRGIPPGRYFTASADAIGAQVAELGNRALAEIMGRLRR